MNDKLATALENNKMVRSENEVYPDPPGHEEIPELLRPTTAVLEADRQGREEMVSRLFDQAKPSDLRRPILRDHADETLRDMTSRVTGRR